MEIANSCIVLTGASSGIGKALLNKLQRLSARIVVGDLFPEGITPSERIYPLYCDVRRKDDIDRLFEKAIQIMGRIDICIANAGFAYYEKIRNADYDHIAQIVAVNYIAPIYMLQKMMEINVDRECMVVFNASAMAKLPLPGYALYSATKAALDAFTTAFKYERDKNIHLAIVYPIATKTHFFSTAGKNTPIPFPAQTPEHVADAIINGIKRNKNSIYPSKLFQCLLFIHRFIPIVLWAYVKVEQWKFLRWLKNEGKRNNL